MCFLGFKIENHYKWGWGDDVNEKRVVSLTIYTFSPQYSSRQKKGWWSKTEGESPYLHA